MQAVATPPPPAIELEHAIGYNAGYGSCVADPRGGRYFYLAGGSLVEAALDTIHEQHFLRGTEEHVGLLAITSSGRRLVTAQTSGQAPDVVVWDTDSKAIVFRLTEHDHGVAALAVSADEKLLLTVGSSQDRRIVVWDMSNGGMVAVTQIPATDDFASASCCAWGGLVEDVKRRKTNAYHFVVASGTTVHRFQVNPFESGQITAVRTNCGSLVRRWTSAAYSAQGDLLFLGSETGDLCIINTADGVCAKAQRVFHAGVRFIVCEDDAAAADDTTDNFRYARFGAHATRQSHLRIGSAAGEVVHCRVADHASPALQQLRSHNVGAPVVALAKLPAGGALVGTAAGSICRIDDSASGDLAVTRLSAAPLGAVAAVCYHPTRSDTFASASADGVVRVWDLSTYSEVCRGAVETGQGRRPKGTQQGATLPSEASVGNQRGAQADAPTPLCVRYVGHTDTALTGWTDGSIRCFDTIDGQMHWQIPNAHAGHCTDVVVASNLSFFVTAGAQGDIKVWSLKSHTLLRELKEHKSRVTSLHLFGDDTHLLSASHDRSLLTWNLSTGQRVATNMLQMGLIHSAWLCRNQQNFLSTGSDKRVSLWDTRQHEPVRQAAINSRFSDVMANTIAGSSSDKFFATGGTDQAVTLWELATLRPIQAAAGHSAAINCVQFAPDERQLLSCGNDRSVVVWNFYNQ